MRLSLALVCLLPCISPGQTVTLTNGSNWRDYPSYVVGDPFYLTVHGATPNKLVTMDAERDGDPTPYHWELGNTDSFGNFSTNGTMGTWNIGDWTETVYIDGAPASPTLEFSVEEPESCSFSPFGTGNIPPMYAEDYWEYWDDKPMVTASPEEETHENTSGPCGAVYAWALTDYVDAEYDFEEYSHPHGGYKKVEWTITLSDRASGLRHSD